MSFSNLASTVALVAALGAAACGDDGTALDGGGADAGADGSMQDAGAPVAPEAPMLPRFGPCPDGWRTAPSGDGFDLCEPFPADGRPTCGRDEAFFPGAAGCVAIGTACPVGDFPADLPADAPVIYVLAGAAAGDGSEASPYGTIAEATSVAAPGTTIAVGKGTYQEAVSVPGGVSLVGACVAETLITFDGGSYTLGVVEATGADVTIRNLRVGDAARPGITIIGEGRSATIEDVVVHDCAVGGIAVEMGGELTGSRVVSRDHRSVEALGSFGRGLSVESGARATVRWLHVEGVREAGVVVQIDAQLTLEDATIADVALAAPTADLGAGLVVADRSRLVARRVVVDQATMLAVIAQFAETEVTLEDVVVRRTRPGNLFGGARGVDVTDDATLQCTRCLIEDLLESGVAAATRGVVTLTDTLIRRVGAREEDQRLGRAFSLQGGGEIHVQRVVAVDLRDHGAAVQQAGTLFAGTDLVIRRVREELWADTFGRGMAFDHDAEGRLERVEISDVREVGVLASRGAKLTLTDFTVQDVRPDAAGNAFGRGVAAQGDSTIVLSRARVRRVFDVAVGALEVGAVIQASDLSVADVAPQACAGDVPDSLCSLIPGGHGIGSYIGARIEVDHFSISSVDFCGVHVADEATVRLDDGVVSGAVIGACLQSDAQELADLQDGVRYVDNGTNLEATTLPVPATLGTLE